MKKLFLLVAVASVGLLSSCSGMLHTATSVYVPTEIQSASVADLEVGDRVRYTYTTTSKDRKLGAKNCKAAAVAALLKANGNADIIVSPEYRYDTKLETIEVTGRPAKYKNFRSAN